MSRRSVCFSLPVAFIGLLALGTSIVCAAGPDPQFDRLPAPTGPHSCGRTTFVWIDKAREETWTDEPGDRREILAVVWYPAQVADGAKPGPYFPRVEKLPGGPKGFDGGLLQRLVTHTFDEAPLAPGDVPAPVLLFSPGAGAAPYYYTTLFEELASHGYVVVALDHCYEGRGQVFPDGHTIAPLVEANRPAAQGPEAEQLNRDFYRRRVDVRAADAKFVVDQLTRLNHEDTRFASRLAVDRIGIFGHSLGGVAAPQACAVDKRLAAAANLDGMVASRPLFLDADGGGIRQPFLYVGKTLRELSEDQRTKRGMTLEQWNQLKADIDQRQVETLMRIGGGAHRVLITGATHSSFGDEVYFFPQELDAKRHITALVREYLVAFFDHVLRDRPAAILDSGKNRDGVRIDRYPLR